VQMTLDQRAFSIWDTGSHSWRVAPGCYGISVGSSSAQLPLHGEVARAGGHC